MHILIILFENLMIGLLLKDAIKTIKIKSEASVLRILLGIIIVWSYLWQLYFVYTKEYKFAICLELIAMSALYGFSHLVNGKKNKDALEK
ncbi:MAG: hypothetical protein K5769_05675 [Pseudobutyrivibrio sp.]|nr:hypothetical protein [Pseudobutyrivibrio sp.]